MGMSVLHVIPTFGIGGTENYLRRLNVCLRKSMDSRIHVLDQGHLRANVRMFKPDIIHLYLPKAYLIGTLATIDYPCIKIMSRRSLNLYQKDHKWLPWAERQLHKRMTVLLGNSSVVVSELIHKCGAPEKVGLIHNGVDLPPQSVRANSTFTIIVIANLFSYKGHDDLFAALSRLDFHWRLLIVGRDEGYGRCLQRWADMLHLTGEIQWLGERNDVDQLIQLADIGVVPSYQEGFSNALIEMMAHGLPVVATDVGGNRDAIVSGSSGWLVPAHNPDLMAQAISRLHHNKIERKSISVEARERVRTHFSLNRCARLHLNLYYGLMRHQDGTAEQLIHRGE